MNLYIIFGLLSYLPTALASVNFLWLYGDKRLDCIVGISVNDTPVGIGTVINTRTVVTSANPLEPHIVKKGKNNTEYHDPDNKIKLHAIDHHWDTSKTLSIDGFTANVSHRHAVWIKTGFNKRHSPIHDLIFILITKEQVQKPPVIGRQVFYFDEQLTTDFMNGWTFAGFGYADTEHVLNNTLLETHVYEDSDEADCDEWIPRAWGRFVCLLNVANVEVQSGAPLFHNGLLRGIGSFALKKGKESILVFTDFSLYRELIYDEFTTTTQKPEGE